MAAVLGIVLVTLMAGCEMTRLRFDGDINALLGRDDPVVRLFSELAETSRGHDALLMVCPEDFEMSPEMYDRLLDVPGIDSSLRVHRRSGASTVFPFAIAEAASDVRLVQPVIEAFQQAMGDEGRICGLTGTPVIFLQSQEVLRRDQRLALVVAAILIVFLFAYAYRIGWLALLMLVPIGIGITWGLAAYGLIREDLTLLAATVPALLLGIGIDHCVHLIQGTRFAMAQGLPHI